MATATTGRGRGKGRERGREGEEVSERARAYYALHFCDLIKCHFDRNKLVYACNCLYICMRACVCLCVPLYKRVCVSASLYTCVCVCACLPRAGSAFDPIITTRNGTRIRSRMRSCCAAAHQPAAEQRSQRQLWPRLRDSGRRKQCN